MPGFYGVGTGTLSDVGGSPYRRDMSTIARTASAHPALRRVRDGYWRVTAASGVVLGYVEEVGEGAGIRFRAKRLFAATRIAEVGEFGDVSEAVECLR
jgi:hypothetical protein